MPELNPDELLRYQRHLTLPGFGEAAQLKLKAAKVLVVGAGGLGCPVLQYLAAAGVGTIGIVDDDEVSRSNLQRQILYTDAEVGQPKAELAAQKLQAMNPGINCIACRVRLEVGNALELIEAYDLVVDGSDNYETRYLINDACVLSGKPLVYGALYTFQGQVSVFNFEGGPTYRCLFPKPPKPEDSPNCAEIGVVGVLPGLIGCMQANEAIKVITGIGQPLSGRLLILDALKMQSQTVMLQRDEAQATVTELQAVEFACAVPRVGVEGITAQKLKEDFESYQLLDVREAWERKIFALPGAHIPLKQILSGDADFASVGIDPAKPLCVYCKGGMRSAKAVEALLERGAVQKVVSLRGGILAWVAEVDAKM